MCSEPPRAGRGREAAVSAATSARAKQLCLRRAPPPPRAGRGLRCAWGPGAGSRGPQTGVRAGLQRRPGARGQDWGCACTRRGARRRRAAPTRSPHRAGTPRACCPALREEGDGGRPRSHGNCAERINKPRAARGRPRPPASRWLSSSRFPPGPWIPAPLRGEGCEVRGRGEGEGDPASRGHRLFVPGPKDGARPWRVRLARGATIKPQIRVPKDGLVRFRPSEASEGLNLGVRGKMGSLGQLGWYTLFLKSCPHPSGGGLARWGGWRRWTGRAGALLHGEPEQPAAPRCFPWKPPRNAHRFHVTHCRVTDVLCPSLLIVKC